MFPLDAPNYFFDIRLWVIDLGARLNRRAFAVEMVGPALTSISEPPEVEAEILVDGPRENDFRLCAASKDRTAAQKIEVQPQFDSRDHSFHQYGVTVCRQSLVAMLRRQSRFAARIDRNSEGQTLIQLASRTSPLLFC